MKTQYLENQGIQKLVLFKVNMRSWHLKGKPFVYQNCGTLEACDRVNIKISASQVQSSGRVLGRLSGLAIPLPWQDHFQNTADKCI